MKRAMLLIIFLSPFIANIGWACNCVSGVDDTSYLWATLVLLPLPFLILGAIYWFITRQIKLKGMREKKNSPL